MYEDVWYAAYGPHAPGFDQLGTAGSVPVVLDVGAYFAGEDAQFGGSWIFVDSALEGTCLAIAHRFRVRELEELLTRCGAATLPATFHDVRPGDTWLIGDDTYAAMHCVGEFAGDPVVVSTSRWRHNEVATSAPSVAYLRAMYDLVAAPHGLDEPGFARYVCGIRGALGAWNPHDLTVLLG
jgi:hypothetical protein